MNSEKADLAQSLSQEDLRERVLETWAEVFPEGKKRLTGRGP